MFSLRAVCLGNEVQYKVYHLYYGRICVSSLLEYVGDVAIRHFLEDFSEKDYVREKMDRLRVEWSGTLEVWD